jgi:pilus assembly protein Flp/PilA
MLHFLKSLSNDERGISALEYAVLGGIVVVALAAVGTVMSSTSSGLPSIFTTLMSKIAGMI